MGEAVIALGSNVGDRLGFLARAATALREHLEVQACSSVYETPAWGVEEQPPYLNAVVLAGSPPEPRDLLRLLLRIEEELGRVRTRPGAPREIDLDLVLLGGRIVRQEGLRVPHPRWRERSFVVRPLAEVAPHLRDPETGWTVQEILRRWPTGPAEIRRVGPLFPGQEVP